MADILTSVITEQFRLSTNLLTALSSIAALSRAVAKLPTGVKTALQLLPTDFAAVNLLEMARLVVKSCLPTGAYLLSEIGARRAFNVIRMTLMLNRGMTASGLAPTLGCAIWLASATGLRRLKNRCTAVAANFGPYSFRAALASSTMAELLTEVATTLEWPATDLNTDVLSFNLNRVDTRALLLLLGDPLCCLLLTWAAVLSTSMPPAVPSCLTHLEAQGVLDIPLMADGRGGDSATPTIYIHDLHTRVTITSVTQ